MSVLYLTAPQNGLKGEVGLPYSKSISNRLLIINALSGSSQKIENLSDSSDTVILKEALNICSNKKEINVHDAGTSMRFLTAYLANKPGEYFLTGSERMKKRPIKGLVDSLTTLGADIKYQGKLGYPPLFINGKKLNGGMIEIDAGISSQFISALMMIAPTLKNGLRIRLKNEIASLPYIVMTKEIMEKFGIDIRILNNEIIIREVNYNPGLYSVEPDWTSASYFFALVALSKNGEIFFPGLTKDSIQGDSILYQWFKDFGVTSVFDTKGLTIIKKSSKKPCSANINFKNNPDLAQTMAVFFAGSGQNALMSGLHSLRIKETDRITALQNELEKIGYILQEHSNDKWQLERVNNHSLSSKIPVFETYEDHRMAMSFSILAMTKKVIGIKNPEVVIKSFPSYWENLKAIGFSVSSSP
ncbi:MAG: 3-phosphoshikimate 1-carboxyvinyltransferase [Bacteroidales bacterium]